MKLFFRTLLKYYLKYITKLVLLLKRPLIIAIAGSTNKSFVKENIVLQLKNKGIKARLNPKSFNTEIGLPLAILNLPSGYNDYKNWIPIILKAPLVVFQKDFPKQLVLELGTSDAGDMKYLLSIVKPSIGIITDVTQRYLEGFSDMDELMNEYIYFIKSLKKNCLFIFNNDNIHIRKLKNVSNCKSISFGFTAGSDFQAINTIKNINGQAFDVKHKEEISSHVVNRYGVHQIYAFLIGKITEKYVPN